VQTKKLHHDEKQADHSGQTGVQQVLPVLQKTHGPQGNEIEPSVGVLGDNPAGQ
jgi:hypothetical protein